MKVKKMEVAPAMLSALKMVALGKTEGTADYVEALWEDKDGQN